jgi:outer membrane biosynthesis protein TonB
MVKNKNFQIALVISLAIHTAVLLRLPLIKLFSTRRVEDKTELTYIKEQAILPSLKVYEEIFPKQSSRPPSSKAVAPPPYVMKEKIFEMAKNIPLKKPKFTSPEIIAVKKKITLPSINDEKIDNPVYLDYYQVIRERIKRAAYQNYTSLINGEVYLSFIIMNNGHIKSTRINEEKSTPYAYLKQIAQKSIFDASPFPSFPKDLDYPELSFNVIIAFEVE